MKHAQRKKEVPHAFVLDALEQAEPHTKAMFGMTGVYIGEKIVCVLRQRDAWPEDNGVWVPVLEGGHESLWKEIPSLRSLVEFGEGPTGWQLIPVDHENFEQDVFKVCDLILMGDPRIGKVPKRKSPPRRSGKKPVKKLAKKTSRRKK